jgi:hypothetical protein
MIVTKRVARTIDHAIAANPAHETNGSCPTERPTRAGGGSATIRA